MTDRDSIRKRGLYRSRHGVIFGVCRGIANSLDFSVFWLRAILVILTIVSFSTLFFPLLVLYLIAAVLMKPEPVVPFRNEADREFYDSYASSRTRALDRLSRTYDRLDRRIRRMESVVTSKDFSWDDRMNEK